MKAVETNMQAPQVDGYRILSHLGEGGTSHVWLAERDGDRHNVVLKVLKTTPAEDIDRFQSFRQENAYIVESRHSSVVEILGNGFAGDYPYLAMEYFARGSLRDAVQTALSPRQALAVLAQLAGALVQIHVHGLVHRDLKPENVLVRDDGSMAIADFGMAARMDALRADARKQKVSGSPHYIAPELILGEPASALTDIYSLGIVYFQMLTGRKPFTAATMRELAQLHLSAPIPRLDASIADYQSLLDGMLAKNPQERFQSAEDLLDAVDAVWTMLAVRVAQMR